MGGSDLLRCVSKVWEHKPNKGVVRNTKGKARSRLFWPAYANVSLNKKDSHARLETLHLPTPRYGPPVPLASDSALLRQHWDEGYIDFLSGLFISIHGPSACCIVCFIMTEGQRGWDREGGGGLRVESLAAHDYNKATCTVVWNRVIEACHVW